MQPLASPPAPLSRPRPSPGSGRAHRWRSLAVTVTLGLGSGYLLNRLYPPTSWTESLTSYAIGLLPAALQLGGILLDCDREETPDWVTRTLYPFTLSSEEERQRRERLQLPQVGQLPLVYLTAWLNHTDSLEFSDEEILTASQRVTERSPVANLVIPAWQAGWHCLPLPGSIVLRTSQYRLFRAAITDPDIAFHAVWTYADSQFSLPLEKLAVSDVLVLLMSWQHEGERLFRPLAIERHSEDTFWLFDPMARSFPFSAQTDYNRQIRQALARQGRTSLVMFRLHKEAGDPEPLDP